MDTELAYLAGFFDGEGSVAVGTNHGNKGVRRWYLRVSCHQLDPAPLEIFKRRFGGSIRFDDRFAPRRPIYEWAASSVVAGEAIRAMRPWLIVKAAQVDVALEFQDVISANSAHRHALTEEQQAFREDCYRRLRALKKSRKVTDET